MYSGLPPGFTLRDHSWWARQTICGAGVEPRSGAHKVLCMISHYMISLPSITIFSMLLIFLAILSCVRAYSWLSPFWVVREGGVQVTYLFPAIEGQIVKRIILAGG